MSHIKAVWRAARFTPNSGQQTGQRFVGLWRGRLKHKPHGYLRFEDYRYARAAFVHDTGSNSAHSGNGSHPHESGRAVPSAIQIKKKKHAGKQNRKTASRRSLRKPVMFALGQKRTYAVQQPMSASLSIATAKADSRKRPCPLCPAAKRYGVRDVA